MEQNAQIKAIDLKGIVRNASKLAQQDGEMDELINLRLKDGSWQPTGDGKIVFEMPDGHFFSQMYVHTNIYRHVLGVENGALYWFANIDKDSNFYTGAEGEADNEYHADAYSLFWQNGVYTPIKICDVSGKVTIAQTGHLLTVIDEADAFEYYLYKNDEVHNVQEYKIVKMDGMRVPTDRGMFPFGLVHFNYNTPTPSVLYTKTWDQLETDFFNDGDLNTDNHRHLSLKKNGSTGDYLLDIQKSNLNSCFADLQQHNTFSRPLLVCAAIKLYDDTFMYASNPVLIYPRQAVADTELFYNENYELQSYKKNARYSSKTGVRKYLRYVAGSGSQGSYITNPRYKQVFIEDNPDDYESGLPDFLVNEQNMRNIFPSILEIRTNVSNLSYTAVMGYDLMCDIRDIDILRQNQDIFKSVCIFVTPEIQNFDFNKANSTNEVYSKLRPIEDIIYDLINSPFLLLREYSCENEILELKSNPIISLTDKLYDGLLNQINSGIGKLLTFEAFDNYYYQPQKIYYYNGKLHIANYKKYSNHVNDLDFYCYHNLPLVPKNSPRASKISKLNDDWWWRSHDVCIYPHQSYFPRTRYGRNTYVPAVYIETKIKTDNGVVSSVFYYDKTNFDDDSHEQFASLNPLIIYPDKRAFEMTIYHFNGTRAFKKIISLKEHPLYNLAYYIQPELKPIDIQDTEVTIEFIPPSQKKIGEVFPNGLKVSAVNNPLYFPVESTYQVGSSEIVALMSNTKAVGTGQTGEAPLYVFTKDGVYGLFVDSSGEVAYSTARILTRDVCNNADSVTPIDDGVVFTTDRGLMLMAGEEAKELSQPAEGKPNHFTKVSDKVEYCKIAANALELGALANMANQYTKEDLLEFLKGCIINYNHNERELMVSNPSKNYTYILDREGNWSKRDYTASEYVNNFPTSYRVQNLKFYKVDEESNADNGVYLLTRPIKLDTLAYKQAFRCVVRGVFELMNGEQYAAEQRIATVEPKLILTQLPSRLQSQKDDGGRDLYNYKVDKEIVLQRYTIKEGGYTTVTFMEDEAYLYVIGNAYVVRMSGHIELSVWYKTKFNGHDIWVNVGEVVGRDIEVDDNHITMPLTDLDNSGESYINIDKAQAGEYELRLKVVMDYDSTAYSMQDVLTTENNGFAVTIDHAGKIPLRLGLYVFGSYDGRKWAMIGGKEKTGGMFTDIGCKVERTDIKFLRLCVAGQLKQTSKIDFVEITTEPKIHDKLR